MLGEVLDFWLALDPKQWWSGGPELDENIRERFGKLWRDQRSFPASSFIADAPSALAAVILFDQFPRNMFRGTAEQFATDPLALGIATAAVDRDLDDEIEQDHRSFFYMPFEHSEAIADQRRSLLLFTRLGDTNLLTYAHKHHDIIERFGRFPHRNAMLDRSPRPEEVKAGDVTPF